MSKPSRSSARPAARWRWQRTDQKKRSARSKRRNSAALNRPLSTRSAGPFDAEHIFADPVERVEVAQAALAVLDVGLDDVAAVAHPAVALVALGELGGDIIPRAVPATTSARKRRVASSISSSSPHSQRAFEQRGADGHVALAQRRSASSVRADRLADLQLQIPQYVEHGLDRPGRTTASRDSATRNIRSRSL